MLLDPMELCPFTHRATTAFHAWQHALERASDGGANVPTTSLSWWLLLLSSASSDNKTSNAMLLILVVVASETVSVVITVFRDGGFGSFPRCFLRYGGMLVQFSWYNCDMLVRLACLFPPCRLCRLLVHWYGTKQNRVLLSTIEVQFVASTRNVQELLGCYAFLQEIGCIATQPMTWHMDNPSGNGTNHVWSFVTAF